MKRSGFVSWVECFALPVLLFAVACHAWGYHHPAALRLPTDKPTTTTTRPTTTTTTAKTTPTTTTTAAVPTTTTFETTTTTAAAPTTTLESVTTVKELLEKITTTVSAETVSTLKQNPVKSSTASPEIAKSSYTPIISTPTISSESSTPRDVFLTSTVSPASSVTTILPTSSTSKAPPPQPQVTSDVTKAIVTSSPTTTPRPTTKESATQEASTESSVSTLSSSSSSSPSSSTQKPVETTTSSKSVSTSEFPTTSAATTTITTAKTKTTEETTPAQEEKVTTVQNEVSSTVKAEAEPTEAPFSTDLFSLSSEFSGKEKAGGKACNRSESEVSYWDFGYCSVNCTTDEDCNSQQNERCICDGPCGMSCLTPDLVSVYCDAPGAVENGKALLVGELGLYDYRNQLQRFFHNQKVIFECDEGYTLIDGPQEKICRNGLWFPAVGEPKCVYSDTPGFRWMQATRVKRRAIKSGGTGSLARSKVSGGGGGGGGGASRRGRKRGGSLGAEEEDTEIEAVLCTTLENPYIEIEVVKGGSDPNNTEFSDGAVVKVSCTHGHGVNLQNDTITCDNGRWRPKVPQCSALPCKVPYITHGTFYVGGKALFYLEMKSHGTNIELRCSRGYVLKGPSKFHCWYGEWDLSDAPECIPASCNLPQLDRGSYSSRYRAGMVVGHGTEVDYHCDGEFQKMAPGGPAKCHLGEWRPNKPACFHPSYIHGMKNFTHDKDNRLITSIKRSCGVPQREKGAIFYVEGKPIDFDTDYMFPDGTEVMYRCFTAKPKLKNRWKMLCEDGQWIGGTSNITCEYNATIAANLTSIKDTIRMINSSCEYKKKETHVVTFFNDQQLTVDSTEFPPNSVLINRCVDIGKFKLKGAVRRKCISGQWLGITPKCEGLSQYYDYVVDKPPTILFRYLNGSIVQTNDGKLMVYPGTTLHMECLYIRKFGRPQWNVSNSHKSYPEGWTDGIENRDPSLEYRLTIDEASEDDSGVYQCITPSRHGHQIDITVKKVDCPALPDRADLVYSTDSTMLGTRVTFQCKDGNSLIGADEIVCQATGTWSAPLPKCENIECPDISMVPAMAPLAYTSAARNGTLKRNETAPPKITIMSKEVGGKATFSCAQGYMVEGATEAVCQTNGEWSAPMPLCKEVECSPPPSPQNGFVTGNPPYKAGDLAQFECRQGYMMEGQPIIACQDNGKWSRASSTTKCAKACTYPGTTIGGTISAVKFYYPIGETVEFDCTEGYDLQGSRMLHCLDSAKWSTSIPNCIPREGSAGPSGKRK